MDRTSRSLWSNIDIACPMNYKPGGTGIVTLGVSSSRIKEGDNDKLGRWSYQIFDAKGKRDVMIISIYQCYNPSTSEGLITAHRQQVMQLSAMNRADRNPRKNFKKDLIRLIKQKQTQNPSLVPIIVGDWNEECSGTSTSMELCKEFRLVSIFDK